MIRHFAFVAAAGLLTACSSARNYTLAAGPRYAGGVAPDPRTRDILKVVVFNVQHARHVDRAAALIQQSAALVDPDILLLQEMDEPGTRAIADSLRLSYVYYPATVSPTTHRDFGNAILSRYPIMDDRKIILPHLARFGHMQREAVGVTILIGDRRIRIYSVHLATMAEAGPGARRQQLAAVLADADTFAAVVVGGDFNSGTVPEIALQQGYTWPTRHLGRTRWLWDVDHVLVKGLSSTADSAAGMVRNVQGASDHRPVWARFVLPSRVALGTAPRAGAVRSR